MFDYGRVMPNRDLADHELDSLRRSLAMLQTNQLALTRDQGIHLVTQLLGLRQHVRQIEAQLGNRRTRAADEITRSDGPPRT